MSGKPDIRAMLINQPVLERLSADEPGRETLLEQYKLCVEMADRISARRMTTNSFFLTINSALVAFVGYAETGGRAGGTVAPALVGLSGVVLCYLWYRLIRSYRGLNTGKFLVVHEIETLLPLRLYDAEWEAIGRGKDPRRYLPVTHIEEYVPWVFIAIHLGAVAFGLLFAGGAPIPAPSG